MSKEENKKQPEDLKPQTFVEEKKLPYKVKKEFTLDKLYKPGNTILLSEGKYKETLISNKLI